MPAEDTAAVNPLRQRLGRAGGSLRPRAAGFWAWWTHALASWLPLRVRELFGLARERLLLVAAPEGLGLALARGTEPGTRDAGCLPWPVLAEGGVEAGADGVVDPLAGVLTDRVAKLPRWLLLPAAAGLRRTLVLPAAAADRLRDVLAFEIERQTPFAAADVEYDARVTGRRGDGQIEAELVVVPRQVLEARLGELGPLAATLTGVDMAGEDGVAFGINLLPGARRHRRSDPWLAWNLALGAVAVIATAAGLWQLLANREAAAAAFEQEVEQRATLARGAAAEKKQLVDLVEGMAFLQATRAARPTTVEVLDELARRLPDTTYIEKLSVEDERILLIGLSSEASSLVQRLEGSPLWRSPALTGALQPDPRSGRDRFTLTAELAVARPANAAREGGNARSNP